MRSGLLWKIEIFIRRIIEAGTVRGLSESRSMFYAVLNARSIRLSEGPRAHGFV